MNAWTLLHADALKALRAMPDNSAHGCFCDPPYGIAFMAKRWDYDLPKIAIWRELLRVLRPGAHALIFGSPRTWHRLACRVEDAGFELRDTCLFLHAKGFPKSLDVSKAIDREAGAVRPVVGPSPYASRRPNGIGGSVAHGEYATTPGHSLTAPATAWDGFGTALKPAWEPALLFRKPLEGTVAENALRWGTGGLAIDASRIGASGGTAQPDGLGSGARGAVFGAISRPCSPVPIEGGRWPANVILDEAAAEMLDAAVGNRPSTPYPSAAASTSDFFPMSKRSAGGFLEDGGPSRFFFTAKTSTAEREAGCQFLPHRSASETTGGRAEGSAGLDSPRTGAGRGSGARNHHPTLKPIALAKYLARLILPPTPDAVLLVPFAGTGSEMMGGLLAGWPRVIGIEREADYVEIAKARIPRHLDVTEYVQPDLFT